MSKKPSLKMNTEWIAQMNELFKNVKKYPIQPKSKEQKELEMAQSDDFDQIVADCVNPRHRWNHENL